MHESVKQIIDQQLQAITNYKDKIIKQQLENNGIEIDPDRLKNQRFKRLVCEVKGDDEYWYYDNGTDYGKLLLKFTVRKSESGFGTVINYITPNQ